MHSKQNDVADLDSYDLKLLAEVHADARIPQNVLGERVNLSTAAVNRRLKKLTEQGVIQGYCAVLSPEALNYHLTVITMIEVESEQIDALDATREAFTACPFVQQCYYVTGEWDFVLTFVVKHMNQYNDLTRKLFFANSNVKRFKTLVAMDRSKVSLDVTISS